MMPVPKNDAFYLDAAIQEVTEVLTQKRQDWATGMEVFECFDAQAEFGDNPIEFAIKMCNLKMTRLKSCVHRRHAETIAPGLERDLEDSLKDLAGYALLALGLYKRSLGQNPQKSTPEVEPTWDDPLGLRGRTYQTHQDGVMMDSETQRKLNEVYYGVEEAPTRKTP